MFIILCYNIIGQKVEKKENINMLDLKSIRKDYVTASETVYALKGVSISFRKTEFVSILGPSGCGKTTLLNIIGGLDHYTDGDLVIGGRSTKEYGDRDWDVYRNHRVGFIFQSYNLIPHQTILGNVELALTIAGISKEERVERAKTALDRVGLKGQYYKKPNQLSGGQCQRVAIARALVNNPEILLADEPTGALDTVTSVQIMDLIKEISEERLVVMVTHNPELAEQYSTRIVRLLDGEIIEDTNPMTEEEVSAELKTEEEVSSELMAEEEDIALDAATLEAMPKLNKKEIKARNKCREKAKMSFFTAFMLSAKNLLSKKGRTAMVGFAGSIGIIGIAMVLAFSAGIKGYVASMQDDMLSGNPIVISKTAYDLEALTGMMEASEVSEVIDKLDKHVYVSSLVEYIAKMENDISSIVMENTITEDYIEYVKAMPKEYYNAMLVSYGIDLNNNLYTSFYETTEDKANGEVRNISVSALTTLYTQILKETSFKSFASYISTIAPSMAQMPNSNDYILSQYDVAAGKIAEGKNQIMLVLDPNDELSDLLLARFGFYTQDEFLEIVYKATEDENFDENLYKDSFHYDELLGKTLTWYPNDTVFSSTEMMGQTFLTYSYDSTDFAADDSVELEVVGILTPKDTVNYGCLTSGIYYTSELTDHILETNRDSKIVEHIANIDESITDTTQAMMKYYIYYQYEYTFAPKGETAETKTAMGTIGPSMSMEDLMGSMMGGTGESAFDHAEFKERMIRNLGGNDLANDVKIYPVSFDEKDLVTDYLDKWNEEGDITVNGKTLTLEDRGGEISYTDALELVISMINTMIDVISYALIAFTSISLVVSTVMIGIITYVSVVERIKEIGVIRSLGGRKKDVSHLFNAETFIIGSLAGLFGIGVTYLISTIVNVILKPLIGYPNIAALPINQAVLLVILSVVLTSISGLIPASSAAKKDPVVALRTE